MTPSGALLRNRPSRPFPTGTCAIRGRAGLQIRELPEPDGGAAVLGDAVQGRGRGQAERVGIVGGDHEVEILTDVDPVRMGEQAGIGDAMNARHVAGGPTCLGGGVFADDRAVQPQLDQPARRGQVLGTHVGDEQVAVGRLGEVVDAGEILDVLGRRDQRAFRDVQRVGDIAAEHVGTDQPAQVKIAVPADGDRLVRHVMRLVEHIRRNAAWRKIIFGRQAERAGQAKIVEQVHAGDTLQRGGVDHLAIGRRARIRIDDGEEVRAAPLVILVLVRRPDRQIARAGIGAQRHGDHKGQHKYP